MVILQNKWQHLNWYWLSNPQSVSCFSKGRISCGAGCYSLLTGEAILYALSKNNGLLIFFELQVILEMCQKLLLISAKK